jgi:hypothetical protein
MIIGSSLAAFSSPIGPSANAGFSGLRLAPQKPGNDAPFAAPNALQAPNADPAKPAQRGSLINLSV